MSTDWVDDQNDLMAQMQAQGYHALGGVTVNGQAPQGAPQQGAAGGLPRTMAQYQPMQRPMRAQARPRSAQAQHTDEQLGLALMMSGNDKYAALGKTLFPKTLGSDDGYKEQMADIRHQEQMQQRYAQMNAPKSALVNVNTGPQGPEFGTVPSSEMMTQLPDGSYMQKPVTGGAAYREMVADIQKREAGLRSLAELDRLAAALGDHPGIGLGVGPGANLMRKIPGSQARSFETAERRVLAKTFMEAFQSLKGGGPITDIEGQTATAALATMNDPTISEADYREAILELRNSLARIQQEQSQYIRTFGEMIGYAPPPLEVNVNAGQEVWTKDANGQWVRGQ